MSAKRFAGRQNGGRGWGEFKFKCMYVRERGVKSNSLNNNTQLLQSLFRGFVPRKLLRVALPASIKFSINKNLDEPNWGGFSSVNQRSLCSLGAWIFSRVVSVAGDTRDGPKRIFIDPLDLSVGPLEALIEQGKVPNRSRLC